MAIPKGATVRQVVPVITGTVVDKRYDEARDDLEYLVAFEADGEQHQRWFAADQIEEVTQ